MQCLSGFFRKLMDIGRLRLLLFAAAASEALTAVIVSGISILFHGRILPDYLATGAVTALVVSLIVGSLFLLLLERIKRGEERFRVLFESVTDAIFILDEKGTFIDANRAAYTRLGYSKEELLSLHVSSLDPPEFAARVPERLRQLARDGHAVFESVHVRKDGSVMPVEVNARIVELGGETRVVSIVRDITERKRDAESLQKTTQTLGAIIDHSPLAIICTDAEGNVLIWNPAAERIFGWNGSETLGRKNPIVPDAKREEYRRLQQRIREDAPFYSLELQRQRKDGSPVLLNAASAAIRDKGGDVVALLGIFEDITERKRAEEALRESERRFRGAFENAGLGASIVDLSGRFIKVNRFLCELLGYSEAELLSKTFSDVTHPDDVWIGLDYLKRQIAGELEFSSFEKRYIRKDGSVINLIISPAIIRDGRGAPQYFVGLFQDITDRKRAEEELRKSEESLARAQTISHVGDWEWDVTTNAVHWSDELYRIYGFEPHSLAPDYGLILARMHPESKDEFVRAIDAALREDKHFEMDYRFFRNDGSEAALHTIGRVERDARGAPVRMMGIVQDITDRKRAEEELRKHEEHLERLVEERTAELKTTNDALRREISKREAMEQEVLRSQKLEALGTLAGGIAHDFNNMLASIMNHISLAMFDLDPSRETYRQIEGAERATLRARDLTQQLLTFSKGGAPVRKVVHVGPIIAEAAGFALRGSGARSDLRIPSDLWTVNADEGQLSQVIHNLVINADQSMPDGGIVTVECRNVALDEGGLLPIKAGQYVLISVSDTGTGIAKEHHDRVFDPYFTTKQKGSGLGLATSYSIVTKHGGHIGLDSEPGKGTAFRIYLPADDGAVASQAAADDRPVLGRGRVLLMDDDDSLRETCGDILTRLGYTPSFARDGAEAVNLYRAARESGAPIDLVILDLTVPGGMGGKQAMEQLLRFDPRVKAVVSSGYSNDPVMADYRAYGFRGLVSKPYRIAELSRVLRDMLASDQVGG